MSGNRVFIQARLDSTRALIIAYEEAVTALVTGGVQSYTLNTSQSVQTVNKFDLNTLNATLDALYNRCATLEARLGMGAGTILSSPDW